MLAARGNGHVHGQVVDGLPGQSGHCHFSLLESDGSNAFAGENVPDRARWAIGGLVQYIPQFLPMLAPTVNSFARLVKGPGAPTASTWGVDNRTAAFRFIPAAPRSASSAESVAQTATPTSLPPRLWAPPCSASNNASNHPKR